MSDLHIDPTHLLRQYFGYRAFREGQLSAIGSLTSGRDVLCVMPTGAGKSICYQIPAMIFTGATIVISPLISLMKDQVDSLRQNGVEAASINSSMDWDQVRPIFQKVRSGEIRLLYIAPERLESVGFRNFLRDIEISMFVVDEAHCVSHWGHDFRPSYLSIAPTVQELDTRPPVAAFTATATPTVREDITIGLDLKDPELILTGFDRENLFFQVEHPSDKDVFLKNYIKNFPNMPGIVYCSTRKTVEAVCSMLQEANISAVRYHAGLSDAERMHNQEEFIYDRASVMVATNAFGMGIDKSNVRFVIHYNMPQSVDSYYQEAGRAGRDGAPSDCILLYAPKDVNTISFLISKMEDPDAKSAAYKKMGVIKDYANTSNCLRGFILRYFGEIDVPSNCGKCGNCASVLARRDVTLEARKIVSCVYRMAQRSKGKWFGADVIAGVLCGSKSAKVIENSFDKISTWGIMCNEGADYIKKIIDFLVSEKILTKKDGIDTTIHLTRRSMSFLKRSTQLLMRNYSDEDAGMRAVKTASSRKRSNLGQINGEKVELFEMLREFRSTMSHKVGVPPYMIFSDRALMALCDAEPSDREQLMQIPGIGEVKIERYGDELLKALDRWRHR